MLNRPARNASATPRPVNRKGVAQISVSLKARGEGGPDVQRREDGQAGDRQPHGLTGGTPDLIDPSASLRSISMSRALTASGTSPSRAWNGAKPTGPVNKPLVKVPSFAARII